MMMKPGDTLLQGRYRILGLLGSGSNGTVYLARHTTLQVDRAIKVINRRQMSANASREADILKRLRHPAIPLIYDIEVTPQHVMIIEEAVSGQSLQSLIFPHNTISYHEVIQYGLQLCEVVDYLHEHGICHYDLKPDNILIDHGFLRLVDYGSAVSLSSEEATCHTGTRGYAAPEQYYKGKSGTLADIYSIGIVLLVMAAGSRELAALDALQPKELQRIICKCLSHAPKERYASVKKLITALQSIQKDSNVPGILKIHFAGILPHCGTTHCAMAAAKHFKKEHHQPILWEKNASGDFHKIIRASGRMSFANGVFCADGLHYVPDYGGAIVPEIPPRFDRILYDDGVVEPSNWEELRKADYVCLVCGTSPQEVCALEEFLREDPLSMKLQPERFRLLLNWSSAKRYKRVARQLPGVRPIRVPYEPFG